MEQHIPLGMIMALNVLPSQQPPIPIEVPTEGPCPGNFVGSAGQEGVSKSTLLEENKNLEMRIADLEKQLKEKSGVQCGEQ